MTDQQIMRIAGTTELSGDAILEFARRLLAASPSPSHDEMVAAASLQAHQELLLKQARKDERSRADRAACESSRRWRGF